MILDFKDNYLGVNGHFNIRGNGKMIYYQFEGLKINGERNRIYRKGAYTEEGAIAAFRKAVKEDRFPGSTGIPKDTLLKDFLQIWFQKYVVNYSIKTQENYNRVIKNHINPKLGHYPMFCINLTVLEDFFIEKMNSYYETKNIKKKYSKTYVKQIKAILSKALDYGVKQEVIAHNPLKGWSLPGSNKKILRRLLSEEEVLKVLETFPKGHPFFIPLIIGYYCGGRISEPVMLTWQDIDLENGTIDINKAHKYDKKHYFDNPKRDSFRKFRIGKSLISILREHKHQQKINRMKYGDSYKRYFAVPAVIKNKNVHLISTCKDSKDNQELDLVCTRENGEHINSTTMKYVNKKLKKNGLDFHFHMFRYLRTTELKEMKVTKVGIRNLTGHSPSRFDSEDEHYAIASASIQNEVAQAIEKSTSSVMQIINTSNQ